MSSYARGLKLLPYATCGMGVTCQLRVKHEEKGYEKEEKRVPYLPTLFFPTPNLYKAPTFLSTFTSIHPSNPHTSPSNATLSLPV
ncbi:hypothetical protein RJT34_14896 [Clitoria ternatea]|uniref:Uncharacterized protein n=1 Tax=Clitoria ternatea TaxID=43366 RepID=A0AAN9JUQ7_CLITE